MSKRARLLRQVFAAAILGLLWSLACAQDLRIVYYDVAGNSAGALRSQLNAKGPLGKEGQRFDAYTKWYVGWTYHYRPTASGCTLTDVKVSVEGTMTLPRWVDIHHGSQPLVAKWDRYLSALRLHEQGHYTHGLDAAKDVEALGRSFHEPGACPAFVADFRAQARAIVARYAAMDATYDRETEHGKTQGAVFP